MSAATRDTGTDGTTKHDQRTGGAWERGLSQEGGPGDGRAGPGDAAAPSSNSQLPRLGVRDSREPTCGAGVQIAEPEFQDWAWLGGFPAAT